MNIYIYPSSEDGSIAGRFVAQVEYPSIIGEPVVCFYQAATGTTGHPHIPDVFVPTRRDGTAFPDRCAFPVFRAAVESAGRVAGLVTNMAE